MKQTIDQLTKALECEISEAVIKGDSFDELQNRLKQSELPQYIARSIVQDETASAIKAAANKDTGQPENDK